MLARVSVLDDLVALELRFLDPAERRAPEGLGALLSDDFYEVGASGQEYDKAGVLDALRAEVDAAPTTLSGPVVRPIGPDLFLLTFTVTRETRVSLRASLWERRGAGWVLRFHQGTLRA
mgnify:CR=1 FL=1